ncbi:hypothetical protein GCM10011380_17330 [Sphingomonas metalli]|uniref:Chemotaxis protein CheA n=1 Tax=Sphingomonas metalli TaxID=1779358 RepID=A0A916WSE3_9SPHN|nr:chemotaxis protein CheA [Sphingomonas metalli]GGB28257.1 hypothetical protein GCM10011380_17330 [Sphingomonas metalli]
MNTVLLERFVQEARELLQASASGLLTLERNPTDATAINEVFRAVHTLKGSSGLFDTPALTRLVHAGEDVLSQVRTGALALDSNLVDLLLDSLDQVGGFIDQLDRDGTLAGDADRIASQHAGALRARLGGAESAAPVVVDAVLEPAPAAWLTGFAEPHRTALLDRARAGEAILVVRYTPEEGCFYTGTDPLAAMLPVAEVFDRFPRLVRDIARRLDKQVELVMEGADTAADKTIVEALGDPLLHIVRNSLDHGIEEPATRTAAGKPAAATLRLRAWQDNDCVVIEIADDGRGIDPVRIRKAAVDKGLVTREQADGLSDQEAINLIYRPGFSTAAEISDLSGRGVGMDVVLSTVQKLGGRVSVSSQLGQGTVTRLSLPLSMAVTRVMVVEIGGSLYGIPIDHVVQTTRLDPSVIQRIKHREVFVLRDEVVPLVRMTALLGGRPAAVDRERGEAVLVCRFEGRTVGLVIDDFREGMDVILKPMTGLLAEVSGYCGTTLLGDGRVLLVLDLKELL